jgi:hypothetical protein
MKYVTYDKNTGKILGYYDDTIHKNIPKPNTQITEEQWKECINNNYNFVDVTNNTFRKKDFRTLDQIKQAKKQRIDSIYERAIQEPIVYNVNGSDYIFQADKDSQDILTKVITSASSNFEIDWLDIDNNLVHMTLNDLKGLANNILVRGQEKFIKKVGLKRQIDSCNTVEELNSITIGDNNE